MKKNTGSFKTFFSRKNIIIGTTGLCLIIAISTAITLGIRSNASKDHKQNGFTGYETGLVEMDSADKSWIENNVVNIGNAEDYYDFAEDGEIGCTYNEKDAAKKEADAKASAAEAGVKVNDDINASSDTTEEIGASDEDTPESSYVFPAAIDNSTSDYFPEIGNQGSIGSCVSWAMAYYQMSYMYNREMNRSSKDTENLFSPMWTYEMAGGSESAVAKILTQMGAAPLDKVPALTSYPNNAYISRMFASDNIWKTALNYRLDSFYLLEDPIGCNITSPKSEALDGIKAALNNGEILTFTTDVYKWRESRIQYSSNDSKYNDTTNQKFDGQYIVGRCDLAGGGLHRMTIVGYDDNIWLDINENGIKEDGEMGALKIANSWGEFWDNKGFVWLSYDALNSSSSVRETSSINLSSGRTAAIYDIMGFKIKTKINKMYAKFTINTDFRGELDIDISAHDDKNNYNYDVLEFDSYGSKIGFDGTSNATDGVFYVALDNVVPDITSNDITNKVWKVRFNDRLNNESSLTVKNVEIIDENSDCVYPQAINKAFTINGQFKNALIPTADQNTAGNYVTIYYKGYDTPYIHYCVENGNWTTAPGIAMKATKEKTGYTHVATINLGQASKASVCFNDGNGNWDSRDGANYSFSKGVYTFTSESYTKIEDTKTSFGATLTTSEYDTHELLKPVTLTANASSADNNLLYRFGYSLFGEEHYLTDYTSKNTCVWEAALEGSYNLFVDVKASDNTVIRRYIYDYYVSAMVINDMSANLYSPQRAGTSIVLSTKTSYEVLKDNKPNTYKYEIIDNNGKTTVLDTASDNTATWTPTVKGDYTVKVTVTDAAKQTQSFWFSYKITSSDPSLKIEALSFNGGQEVIKGMYSSATVEIDGGVEPYNICFGYIDENGDDYYEYSNSVSPYFSMYSPRVGDVTFFATVTDGAGTTVRKEKTVDVKGCIVTRFNAQPSSNAHVGDNVLLSVETMYEVNYRGSNSRVYVITNNETGESETLSQFTYSGSTVTWVPKAAGTYTLDVTVHTYGSGAAYSTMQYTVLDRIDDGKFHINNIRPSIKSPARVGDSIYFDVDTMNEKEDDATKRIYTINNLNTGTVKTLADYPFNKNMSRMFWAPTEIGTYSISLTESSGSESDTMKFEYIINPGVEDDSAIIYYKGFTTPYIHYKVGNGEWTTDPGIMMEPCTDVAGYTHKATILIGTNTSTTVCFNDGNGNWDSNNGKNYVFNKGRFVYSNGEINKLDESNNIVNKSNVTDIYYSGYVNPYMHYKIGDGQWTTAPGLPMFPTSDYPGYSYHISVDLGEATSLTACFNDGNNNWDNNYGNNYTFGAGTYTFSGGNVEFQHN